MQRLFTEAAERLTDIPWMDYPRPQMVRKDWLCLNGPWEYEHASYQGSILVPFCPESLLSGVDFPVQYGREMIYRKRFTIPEHWVDNRILLHFGAVNRKTVVHLNGTALCTHENGYLPFSVEVTNSIKRGDNVLTVTVTNDLSHQYPWGKQKKHRGGMWYTPVSGIWQTVWLEPVPQNYVKELSIRTGANWVDIQAEGMDQGTIQIDGLQKSVPLHRGRAHIEFSSPKQWTPDRPHLYYFTLKSDADEVRSYFALREFSVKRIDGIPRMCLNGEAFFFHGLLDQGYWSDGLYTPADADGFQRDIRYVKSLGFNTLRKHIKVEPERYYYDCDRLGMIVFQDMVNCGNYNYVGDTVLPTLGFQRRKDQNRHRNRKTRANFLQTMEDTVHILQNHPCIALFTIFNEGWGQFQADAAYHRMKEIEPDRFVNATSGWFHQEYSDVEGSHIYFDRLHLGTRDRPQMITEFGGYSYKIPEHSFNLDKTYGYRKYAARDEFVSAIRQVYEDEVLPLITKGLCGAIYTQVSDVEDETNGLVTFDRKVRKIAPDEFADLSARIQKQSIDG